VKTRTSIAVPALLLGGSLAACSFAPPYQAPDTGAAPAAYQGNSDWKQAEPADALPRGNWWSVFKDPQLDALEARVTESNQDIKAAYARLQQARAQVRVNRADLFPTITAGPTVSRSRTSVNSPTFVPGGKPVYNNLNLEADFSYEIDVWGRVRNTVNAAKASAQATAADLATLDLATHAELASDYFTLRSDDAQQNLLDQTVADYTKALQLAQNLYNGGAAAISDVAQAQAQLDTATTSAADIRLQRDQMEHAIAVLTGAVATDFHLDALPLPVDAVPPPIDPGLPSALLERRPDVAAAERRAAAANAQIGVARAAYYPVFSLNASAGFDSKTPSNWISAPSTMWSVGPSAMLTVFDAGRHHALTDQARAALDEEAANYRGSVLNAYREVEDNLVALKQLEQESVSQAAAVTATQKELQQASYRYKAGATTYLEVVTAENASLQAELSAANIQQRRLNASVMLVKALGGGWQKPSNQDQQAAAAARDAAAPVAASVESSPPAVAGADASAPAETKAAMNADPP
jgi:NodT family efflux transporter outer membrane factor (OMF) lipoprotein